MAAVRDLILNLQERKSGNALTDAANDLDKLSRGVDASSDHMKEMESDAKRLQAEISKTTERIKDLRVQVARTGDESLFGDIRKEETRLRNFEKALKGLVTDGRTAGSGFLSGLTDAFDGVGKTLKPALIAGLVAVVIEAAPIIGAMIGGVLSGAFGLVGLAGGVLSALKEPGAQSAFKEFGQEISREFFSGGTAFVDPLRKSLAVLVRDFQALNLDQAFAKAAPSLQILAQGIGDFAKNFMNSGFSDFLERSGPFINEVAVGLADTGEALGEFVDDISRSEGALDGLEAFFRSIVLVIRILGNTIGWLEDRYHDLLVGLEKLFRAAAAVDDALGANELAGKMRQAADNVKDLTTHSEGAADAIQGLGNATGDAADEADRLNDRLGDLLKAEDDQISKALALSNAHLAVAEGWMRLNEELVKGKGNWNENTEAGNKNLRLINDQIAALGRERQEAIRNSDGSTEAINKINQEYDKQLKKLLAIAAAAGLSKEQLEALAKNYYIGIIVDLDAVRARTQKNKAAAVEDSLSRLQGFASGGDTPANMPFRVHQDEIVYPRGRSQYVQTKADAAAMMGDGGARTVRHVVDLMLNGRLIRSLYIDDALARGVPESTIAVALP